MAEESGGLRGIGPQHPQALNALIGNAEMAPARVQWQCCVHKQARVCRALPRPERGAHARQRSPRAFGAHAGISS